MFRVMLAPHRHRTVVSFAQGFFTAPSRAGFVTFRFFMVVVLLPGFRFYFRFILDGLTMFPIANTGRVVVSYYLLFYVRYVSSYLTVLLTVNSYV